LEDEPVLTLDEFIDTGGMYVVVLELDEFVDIGLELDEFISDEDRVFAVLELDEMLFVFGFDEFSGFEDEYKLNACILALSEFFFDDFEDEGELFAPVVLELDEMLFVSCFDEFSGFEDE